MPSFLRHLLRWRIQNLNLFWGLQKFLEALEAEKKKQSQVHHFLGKKWNKDEFFMRWTIRIFVVQWSFEKLDFFYLPIKKIGFITLIVSKFQILKAYLWLIYRKKVEFIVYTFFLSFKKSNILSFWGPQELLVKAKSAQILNCWPLSMS